MVGMTRQNIINEVAKELGITLNKAKPLVEAIFELVKASLESGEGVEISGFGKFVIRHKPARVGRNPKTGKEAEITERKVVTFKPSRLLREPVDG